MTPTLIGRWQTRIALFLTLGVLVTAIVAALGRSGVFFAVLGYVLAFGLVWNITYIALQKLRWDRDWPAAFQVASGIAEGALVLVLLQVTGLPGIVRGSVAPGTFIVHYGLVWLVIFVWVQGPMRALFPRWRFTGGRIV